MNRSPHSPQMKKVIYDYAESLENVNVVDVPKLNRVIDPKQLVSRSKKMRYQFCRFFKFSLFFPVLSKVEYYGMISEERTSDRMDSWNW
jgi:hypothetical protein